MKNKKFLYYVGGIAAVLGIYSLFTFESESVKKKNLKAEELSMLLGGGSSQQGGSQEGIGRDDSISIFDSLFFKSGKISHEDPEDSKGHPLPLGESPINPQTGKPYTEEAMETFDRLHEKFPDNDLIPKRMGPEDKTTKQKFDEKISKATANVVNNIASKDEVVTYYKFQEKSIKDRMQIIKYLIDSQKEAGEEDEGGQFKQILDTTQAQMQQYQTEKENAYKKNGITE